MMKRIRLTLWQEKKFKISGVKIILQAGQVFNFINEFMSVLKDFIIQEDVWL